MVTNEGDVYLCMVNKREESNLSDSKVKPLGSQGQGHEVLRHLKWFH